jgi:putative transposase
MGATIRKAYKYRLYPTKEQAVQIRKTFGAYRFVWNEFLYSNSFGYHTTGFSETNAYRMRNQFTLLRKAVPFYRILNQQPYELLLTI